MRLLSLDYDPVYGDDTERASFMDDTSVFDFDVVIWDPATSFDIYSRYSESYQNLPCLSDDRSVQIQSDAKRRRNEFTEFVNSGRVLVVFASPPLECYVASGQRTYSGTGRNRSVTRIVNRFNLLSALPVPTEVSFIPANGKRIELDGDGPLIQVLRKYLERLEYNVVIKNFSAEQLAHVAGTDRPVAFLQRSKGGGYLVLLPSVDLANSNSVDDEEARDDPWADDAPDFQSDLLDALDRLSGSKVTARPRWAVQFATDEQQRLREELLAQQSKIEAAREALSELQQQQERATARDQLYLGTGRALEVQVKEVLELIGGTVTEPAPGRDDWKVQFPEGKAVVEVKGVSKSAAEKHAAQLEKWVAQEYEATGKAPKGLLIVNTWKDSPLDKRTKDDFPSQMIPYCKGRDHCLITGLQMFVIRADVEAKPDRAEFWRKKLMQTSGTLVGAKDWPKVIKRIESKN